MPVCDVPVFFFFYVCINLLFLCLKFHLVFCPRSQVRSVTDWLIALLDPDCLSSEHPVNHSPVISFKQSAYCVDLDVISLQNLH